MNSYPSTLGDVKSYPVRVQNIKLTLRILMMKLSIILHSLLGASKNINNSKLIQNSLVFLRMSSYRFNQKSLTVILFTNFFPFHK